MPFKGINDPSLPKYMKGRSASIKKKWIAIFNSVFVKDGESAAFVAANSWLKRQIKSKATVARSLSSRERITLTISDKELIKRSDDGEEYLTAVLATTDLHGDGKQFTPELLSNWAENINSGNILVGDVDHELYDKLSDSNISDEMFEEALKDKKGIAKAMKAVYEKGKLFVKLLIDKRYRNRIEGSKGLSVEAIVNNDSQLKTEGDLLGFTFCVDQPVAVPGTGVMI